MSDEQGRWIEELKVLVSEADPAVLGLLPDYLANRRADIGQLENAVENKEAEVVRRLGHNLKGSGGAYGLPPFSDLGARIEIAGRAGNLDEMQVLLGEYRTLVLALAAVINGQDHQDWGK